jgi:hypothetical protein
VTRLRNIGKLLDPEIRAKNLGAMRLKAREWYWRISRQDMRDPIFVLGCSRAGTTVTYETLAASPHLLSFGFELPEFWNDLWGPRHNGWESEAADESHARHWHRTAAFAYFYARLGKGWVLDKTCINALRARYLYKLFPEAFFVYIRRDGRDNVSSMMDGWRLNGHFGLTQFLGPSPAPVTIENGAFTEWSFFLPPRWREYNHARLEEACAWQWMSANRLCLEAGELIPPAQWIPIRYEDLLSRPLAMFQEVFERLDLPFDEPIRGRCKTLDRRPTSIVHGAPTPEKWRRHNPDAIGRIMDMICPMQKALGYDCDL